MKLKILEKLGNNSTDVRVISSKGEFFGVYTFKGNVYVLNNGSDVPFDELDGNLQQSILAAIESGNYEVDNSFQG